MKNGDAMTTIESIVVLFAILGCGITYGTDAFAAIVWNRSLQHLNPAEMTKVIGWVHFHGDRRLPIPGAIGTVAITLSAILSFVQVEIGTGILRAVAALFAFAWLGLYVRIAKPINEEFSNAALEGEILQNASVLHAKWNRIIIPRVLLQGVVIGLAALSLV